MEKNSISVILPIKTGKTKFFEEYFEKAILSLQNQKEKVDEVIIVHTDETYLMGYLSSFDFKDLNVKMEKWTKESNFCAQINQGVKVANSEWVTFFEFDDEFSSVWFKNFKKYAEIYPNVNAFLPIVVDVNDKGVFSTYHSQQTKIF